MLESIEIKSVASYDQQGIIISDLKKVNFIYGVNGSGKTTLTKVFNNLNDIRYSNCKLVWQGGNQLKTVVYNRDFREANFGKGAISGVFTLGQSTKKELEEIRQKTQQLDDIKNIGLKRKVSFEKVMLLLKQWTEAFRERVWLDIYKKAPNIFKNAFIGYMNSKEAFLEKLLYEYENNHAEVKTISELTVKADALFKGAQVRLNFISAIDTVSVPDIEKHSIWSKHVVGRTDIDIAALIQKLNINDWVNEGRKYITHDDICPFCQQETISSDFRKQLEDYFDDTFSQDIQSAHSLREQYHFLADELIDVLTGIEEHERNNKNTKLDVNSFASELNILKAIIAANKERIASKLKEPSRDMTLSSSVESLASLSLLISKANAEISSHNSLVENFATEKQTLVCEIWRYFISENAASINGFLKKRNGLQKGCDQLKIAIEETRKQYLALQDKIRVATKNVTSVPGQSGLN